MARNGGGGRRRALTIGVSDFAAGHDDLPFAGELVPELATALDELGFETAAVSGRTLDTSELGTLVHAELAGLGPEDTLLVHVVSHGHTSHDAPNSPVYVLGSDGAPHSGSDVGRWLSDVQFIEGRPFTLFLLDLCFAGKLARLPWQSEVDTGRARAWVIAACTGGQAAYDGRFTKATANVLRALHAGELDVDPADEHIPLATVARTIHQDVNRLAAADGGYDQQVTASLVDISVDPRPPFFRNPAYTVGGRVQLRAHLDPGLLPFLDDLDEGLDARHFLERAAGIGRLAAHTGGLIGCFSGRKRELRSLSHWLNGDAPGALRVVTGSPGVGKSALLGVLVCAAHPKLRDATKPVWDRVEQAPARLPSLVAVHARRRGLDSIVRSIAQQLGADHVQNAAELVAAVRAAEVPVIVVDALDEADGPETILNDLLLPLASVARLLVGVRDYPEYAPLLRAAEDADGLVDLDRVPADVLNEDLYRYVDDLLRAVPAYRDRRGGVSGAFADEVARVLAEGEASRQWGPFLVAGLYTRQLITRHPDARKLDSDAAARFGAQIPRDLPQVLELDLTGRDDQPWLRPVLTALAHAKGQGMPISVLTRVAPVFGDGTATPADIRSALTAAKFYLRQTTDTDRSTVHRLFHQGLVDHLAPSATDHADPLFNALLAPLGPPSQRDWAAAEPYLLRHAAEHAEVAGRVAELGADLGFLLHPATARGSRSQSAVWSLIDRLRTTVSGRITPAVLALAAARTGMPDIARQAANQPGSPPLTWQPRWTKGEVPTRNANGSVRLLNEYGDIRGVWLSADGAWLAVTRDNAVDAWFPGEPLTTIRLQDDPLVAMSRNGRFFVEATADLVRVTQIEQDFERWSWPMGFRDRPEAVAVNDTGTTVVLVADGKVHTVQSGGASVLADFEHISPVVVTVDQGTPAVVWRDLDDEMTLLVAGEKTNLGQVDGPIPTTAVTPDASKVAWCTTDSVVLWERRIGRRTVLQDAEPTTIALSDSQDLIVIGHASGRVSLHHLGTGEVIADHQEHTVPVVGVAMSDDGAVVASVDETGCALFWRGSGMDQDPKGFSAVAVVPEGDPRLAVVGDVGGFVEAVDLDSGVQHGPAYENEGLVKTIDFQRINGRVLARIDWRHGKSGLLDPVRGLLYGADKFAGTGGYDQRQCAFVEEELVEVAGDGIGNVELRSANSGSVIQRLPGGHQRGVTKAVCGELSGRSVAFTGSLDGTVRVWDLTRREQIDVLEFDGEVYDLDITPAGDLLVCAGGELIAFQHISAVTRP